MGTFDRASGETVTLSLANSNGAAWVLGTPLSNPCTGFTDSNGECTVVFSSNSAGQVTGHASSNVSVGGLSLFRETDGNSPNSDDAVKTFVDAKIEIAPDGTNEVGDPHTFTVTVWEDDGSGSDADNEMGTFDRASGETVTLSLTNSNGAAWVLGTPGGNPCTGVTDSSGECTVVFSSPTAGQVTGNASVTLLVGGVSGVILTRDTDPDTTTIGAGPGGSGPAVKTYVNAKIAIIPPGTNFIHSEHELTCHIEVNDGTGWDLAPAGTLCDVDISGVGSFVSGTDTCTTVGTTGECKVKITSPDTGTTVVSACTSSLTVEEVVLLRCTDGQEVETGHTNSGTVTKTWIAAAVTFTKTFELGASGTSPGGTVCFTLTRVPAALPLDSVSSPEVAMQCKSAAASVSFTWNNLVAGVHTITEDSSGVTPPDTYIVISPIVFTVAADCTRVTPPCVQASSSPTAFDLGTFNDLLLPGDLRILKEEGPTGALWAGPDVNFFICAHPMAGSDTELPLGDCNEGGDSAVVATATITSSTAGSTVTVTGLAEGYYTVCEFPVPAGFTIPAEDQCQVAQVFAGVTGGSAVVLTFINSPPLEGCTPGFWKNHTSVWDEVGDPVAAAAGFTTSTSFNEFFSLTEAQSGFLDAFTMEDAVNARGGGGAKLARHGVSGLLNFASGINYGVSGVADAADLTTQITNAYVTGVFEPLASDIATANMRDHSNCPAT